MHILKQVSTYPYAFKLYEKFMDVYSILSNSLEIYVNQNIYHKKLF